MRVYYITICLVFVLCVIAEQYDWEMVRFDTLGRYSHSQTTKFLYLLASGVLIFVAGLRYEVGTDFNNYYLYYAEYAKEFFERLKSFEEPGFRFICWVVVNLGGDGATVIFVTALITTLLFLRTIYRNTDRLLQATLLFVFLGCWHGCFNGIRQYLAAAIIFSGLRYIKERNLIKYSVVVFCAFLFHSSAILMILAYFVAYNKVNFKKVALMIVGSIVILSSFEKVLELTSIILNEEYSMTYSYLTQAVNTLRVLVAIAPAFFFVAMYGGRKLSHGQTFWLNMLILNAIVMFATSNSTYLARMGIYTAPYLAIGIPELLKGFKYNSRKILTFLIVIAYAIFWWYEISHSETLSNFRFIWQI